MTKHRFMLPGVFYSTAGLRMLKVDLVVACVKTCWILLLHKTLHLMSFLKEFPVYLQCSSCHPALALLTDRRTSCQRRSDHHTSALLRPPRVSGHCFKAGSSAAWSTPDDCVSTSDLPCSAAEVWGMYLQRQNSTE